jgi:uncharacterized membrane protein
MQNSVYRTGARVEWPFRYGMLPLVLASAFACGMVIVRVYLSLSLGYGTMIWNLMLAWIPYLCSLWMVAVFQHRPKQWWWLVGPGVVWLLFFPNATYLATEFVHLRNGYDFPLWYDVGLVLSFAWTGCALAVASLRMVAEIVASYGGRWASWPFVVGVAVLNGIGIYLGRFLRWNSWDAFFNPRAVLQDAILPFLSPWDYPRAVGVTLFFTVFLLLCYFTNTAGMKDEG